MAVRETGRWVPPPRAGKLPRRNKNDCFGWSTVTLWDSTPWTWSTPNRGHFEVGSSHKDRTASTTRVSPRTWINWPWYQDVCSSLQRSSPSPASQIRTGSALESQLVRRHITLQNFHHFHVRRVETGPLLENGLLNVCLKMFAQSSSVKLTDYNVRPSLRGYVGGYYI